MTEEVKVFGTHLHTLYSNPRLRDSTNKVEDVVEYAHEIGMNGLVLTDHEILSGHVKLHQYVKNNQERLGDFKVGFGNEIYLVDRDVISQKIESKEKTTFYHFILIAKNKRGWEGLKELSSLAWHNEFTYRGMQRVPTYKDDLERVMKKYKGDIIGTSACIGGELGRSLFNYQQDNKKEDVQKLNDYLAFCKRVFGDDYYIELQPNHKGSEQDILNELMIRVARKNNIQLIVSTDAHYLNKEQATGHETYLRAKNPLREVREFYATTYMMDYKELSTFFEKTLLDEMLLNCQKIRSQIEPFEFQQEIQVPIANIPNFKESTMFVPYYEKYPYIEKYSKSESEIDRYYLKLIEDGMLIRKQEMNEENLSRINLELGELWEISQKLKQPLSSYFVLTKDIIELMWKVSLVAPNRGSACCFYVNYLLEIVGINPIPYDLPHYRFLSKERVGMPK